jgi:prepilin-type N-terminal cleavage/methylation domain-containing protein
MSRPLSPLSSGQARRPAAGRRARRAYTLLEVLLALAIGAFLMLGLYYALDIQVGRTHSSRKIVERATLARSVVNRIQNDILHNLGPIDLTQTAKAASGGANTASATTTNGTTTSTTSSNTSSNTDSTNSGTSNPFTFNLGVQGDGTHLSLYLSRVPTEAIKTLNAQNGDQAAPLVSDLRRITYWQSASGAGGLARQEVTAVTSDDEISNLPPNVSDETKYVIHAEVVSVQFQYWDGTTWQDSWDGTQPGSDGNTPKGPPSAIAITLTFARPGTGPAAGGQGSPAAGGEQYQYRHVVNIPTAINFVAPTTTAGTPGMSGS